jgi:hypothetical protein
MSLRNGDTVYYHNGAKVLKCKVSSDILIEELKEGNHSATVNLCPNYMEESQDFEDLENFLDISITQVYTQVYKTPHFCH